MGFARVQGTVDLLPTDVLGTTIWRASTETFEFHPGPIFANVVLVDELNRATPKTQSGLLEAMAEQQVTVDGKAHQLPRPFTVPGNIRWRGAWIPVVSVVGAVLTALLWVTSLATHGAARIAGPVWPAIGVVVYLLSRRAGGETLLGRATPAVPDLVAAPEYEMRTILVPLKLSNVGEEVCAAVPKLPSRSSVAPDRKKLRHVAFSAP